MVLDDDDDEPLHIFFFGLWRPGEQRRGGRMVDGVVMERLREGRRLRTIGGGGGGWRVQWGGSGGAIFFCRGGNFCDKRLPRQNFFYPTRRVYLDRNSY